MGDLIEKDRELFRKSFGPDAPTNPRCDIPLQQCGQVVADKAGNIWHLEENGRLLVLIGDHWQLAHESLIAAGFNRGRVLNIMSIGDGQKLFGRTAGGNTDNFLTFFGEVKDGKLLFSQAPEPMPDSLNSLGIRGQDGSFWAICNIWNANRTRDQKFVARNIVCLGSGGICEQIQDIGAPRLVDAAGNLWIQQYGSGYGKFKLWHDGKWGVEFAFPGELDNTPLLSNHPGSVFAWSAEGLQQMIADGPEFRDFRLGPLYSVDNLPGEVQSLLYSKLGYAILLTKERGSDYPFRLSLAKLPDENK